MKSRFYIKKKISNILILGPFQDPNLRKIVQGLQNGFLVFPIN